MGLAWRMICSASRVSLIDCSFLRLVDWLLLIDECTARPQCRAGDTAALRCRCHRTRHVNCTSSATSWARGHIIRRYKTMTPTAMERQQHSEGAVAKAIEHQTAKLPSDTFLWAAVGVMTTSMTLQLMGKDHA